jgi:Flp pilus assembly protein TadD
MTSQGNKAFQEQRYDQAIAHYTKAIQLDDQNAIYVINRAMAYLKAERYGSITF